MGFIMTEEELMQSRRIFRAKMARFVRKNPKFWYAVFGISEIVLGKILIKLGHEILKEFNIKSQEKLEEITTKGKVLLQFMGM